MKGTSANASTEADPSRPPAAVTLRAATAFWARIGCLSFGGPAGQIALMHEELVQRRRWISERRYLHALNYCMLLPGPEAQQLATYIGWLMHGTLGGIIAGVLFVLPSLLILIVLSWLYVAFGDVPVVEGVFYGIKPAVTAIVVQASHRIASRSLKHPALWAIAAASLVAIFALSVPFPLIVLGAALLGVLGGRMAPAVFEAGGGHAASDARDKVAAIIDDDTPTPEHARYRPARLLQVVAAGLALWALPMALLAGTLGWAHTYTQMAWFFTTAALLTFGGAYAVLPYVYQGAVQHYGWVTPTQMIDGLALGETTPGPLIMVVAFVAFIGGYGQALLGPDATFVAGACAAVLVTWFTFLPSFVFILAGGPLVEATHENIRFTAPLTAITAAIVGVVVNLALFFAWHVLWPAGFDGAFEWPAALIAIAAAIALLKYKRGVIEVLACAALAGLAVQLLA